MTYEDYNNYFYKEIQQLNSFINDNESNRATN